MTTRYMAAWYGGPDYSEPYPEQWEPIRSISQAIHMLKSRYANRDCDGRFPCVTEDSEILLYSPELDHYGIPADYPEYRVYFGPRGGVRVERA